jgi:hypothetical protein
MKMEQFMIMIQFIMGQFMIMHDDIVSLMYCTFI